MEINCPICNRKLIYKRSDEKESEVQINSIDEIVEIVHTSDSTTEVYCSNVRSHSIPQDIQDAAITIAEKFGY